MKLIQRSFPVLVPLVVSLVVTACATPNVAPATETPPSPTPLALPGAMTTMPQAMPTMMGSSAQTSGMMQMPATSADLTSASLYQLSCSSCHGQDRAGSTFVVDKQTVKVPELTWDELNKMYSTNSSRGNVHDQLVLAMTKGQNEDGEDMNVMMPRWSALSKEQVDSLIQFLQSDGSTTELSAAAMNLKGEQLYVTSCAACHGLDGAGKTFTMDDQTVKTPSLTWDDLNKMYSTNSSRGNVHDQLVLAITKGQNEDGEDMSTMMPRWSFLSKEQVDSLIQYIQEAFK